MTTEANTRHRTRAVRVVAAAAAFAAITLGGLVTVQASGAPGPTDLKLTKTDSADPIVQDSTLTYTLTVENLGMGGTADAADVKVTDSLPGQVDFNSATSPDGTCTRKGST